MGGKGTLMPPLETRPDSLVETPEVPHLKKKKSVLLLLCLLLLLIILWVQGPKLRSRDPRLLL